MTTPRAKILLSILLLSLSFSLNAEEIAVIVHPAYDASKLDKENIAEIFLGKSKQMTPYDQRESSPIRERFYLLATDKSMSQVKSNWAKLVFSGRANLPEELLSSKAVKRTIASDPKGIGYIEKSAVDSTIQVVLTLE